MRQSDYIDFILDKFRSLDVVTARKMFGGHVLHMAGKVLGFVFDDTFLFEPGPTVDRMLPDAQRKELFPGSKLFVVIDESISPQRLCELAKACYDDFPVSKPRKKKGEAAVKDEERQKKIEAEFPFAKHFR
ncbi:MAG: TfoX/Sxy family protein [Bacteroidales bacterium]|nr:TfoX/Sxy family protein [Bacteroidales bacterium]